MEKSIDKSAFYLLKIDDDNMIVFGHELERALEYYKEKKKIVVWDVAHNFFIKEGAAIKKLSYQQLYKKKVS